MVERGGLQFNLLPRQRGVKRTLATVVREQAGGKDCKVLVCTSKTKLPDSLAGIIKLEEWDVMEFSENSRFVDELCQKILGRTHGLLPHGLLLVRLEFALYEIIKNAAIHGNKQKTGKKILVSFSKVNGGFVIDVYDEGKGTLFLFNKSWRTRELAHWFLLRPGYGGNNTGVMSIQRSFGRENLTATKVYNQQGKRVGTRVSLFVQTLNLTPQIRPGVSRSY